MYYFLKYLAWLVTAATIRFERRGLENVPAGGPLLVVANHMSVSDPVLIGMGLRRKVIFLAKEELFKNALSALVVTQFGAIPVYRSRLNRDALVRTRAVLNSGGVIALFPEGHRSRNGAMNTAQPGSALIASHNRVAILPVGLSGTETIHGIGWLFRRPKVIMNIGQPFCLPDEEGPVDHAKLDTYSEIIMRRIAELLPEKYQGIYAPKGKEDDNQYNPAG